MVKIISGTNISLREPIYKRDDWCCRLCGIRVRRGDGKKNDDPLLANLHHICSPSIGRILQLTNKQLNDPRNIITLCGYCHHEVDESHNKWRQADPSLLAKLEEVTLSVGWLDWLNELGISHLADYIKGKQWELLKQNH